MEVCTEVAACGIVSNLTGNISTMDGKDKVQRLQGNDLETAPFQGSAVSYAR